MFPRWHPTSEEHIAGHSIAWQELEEAFLPPMLRQTGDTAGTLKLIGTTLGGRYLTVVAVPDASDAEKRLYQRKIGKAT